MENSIISSKNIYSNFYTFDSYTCTCYSENSKCTDNKTIFIYPNLDHKIKFGFSPDCGVVRLKQTDEIEKANILGALMKTIDSPENIEEYINENGFFIPIDKPLKIDYSTLFTVVVHIKTVLDIMTELQNKNINYNNLLRLILLMININDCKIENYESFKLDIIKILESKEDTIDKNSQEIFETNCFEVQDSIYKKEVKIKIDEYNKICGNYESNDDFYNMIYIAYCNYKKNDINKTIIDLLFNVETKYGIIDMSQITTSLEYSKKMTKDFDDNIKDTIISVAKYIVKSEIDYNTKCIHPTYDENSMSANWSISSLLSCLYFSIFFLMPNLQIYKKCANIHCKQYFLVDKSDGRRKYCSDECRNIYNVKKYRDNKKSSS